MTYKKKENNSVSRSFIFVNIIILWRKNKKTKTYSQRNKKNITFTHTHTPEAIVCWFSETWPSGTSGRPVSSGRNRAHPRRRPVRPKSAMDRRWGLCRCAGRPARTARWRIAPTGTIGHSEHTIFASRFTHLKHDVHETWKTRIVEGRTFGLKTILSILCNLYTRPYPLVYPTFLSNTYILKLIIIVKNRIISKLLFWKLVIYSHYN